MAASAFTSRWVSSVSAYEALLVRSMFRSIISFNSSLRVVRVVVGVVVRDGSLALGAFLISKPIWDAHLLLSLPLHWCSLRPQSFGWRKLSDSGSS